MHTVFSNMTLKIYGFHKKKDFKKSFFCDMILLENSRVIECKVGKKEKSIESKSIIIRKNIK